MTGPHAKSHDLLPTPPSTFLSTFTSPLSRRADFAPSTFQLCPPPLWSVPLPLWSRWKRAPSGKRKRFHCWTISLQTVLLYLSWGGGWRIVSSFLVIVSTHELASNRGLTSGLFSPQLMFEGRGGELGGGMSGREQSDRSIEVDRHTDRNTSNLWRTHRSFNPGVFRIPRRRLRHETCTFLPFPRRDFDPRFDRSLGR